MDPLSGGLAASAILFGFLFTGFWWSLDRELKFEPAERHFKPSYALLIVSTACVGYFGLVAPLREAARVVPSLINTYRGVSLGLIAVLGYMLTEYAHYSIFQRPKYTTRFEWIFSVATVALLVAAALVLFT